MPSNPRRRPAKLSSKLLSIREKLGYSQNEMVRALGLENDIDRAKISEFESGRRLPAFYVVLEYARVANVWMDYLINDELELPEEIPAKTRIADRTRHSEI